MTMHLGVALDATGLFSLRELTALVARAERGLLDFVTFDDALDATPRLDAVLVAAALAPLTHNIGLVPTAVVTHTEPYHVAKAVATLDFVSHGRAGLLPVVDPGNVTHFGRPPITDLAAQAADYIEVVRRLWDSWEDGAEIRDSPSGRFVDRDKLHYIDFKSEHFSIKGPLITPRPPQGQPLVLGAPAPWADVVLVNPADPIPAGCALAFGDLVVYLDDSPACRPGETGAYVFVGTAQQLADQLIDWADEGFAGFRLRPGDLGTDLDAITRLLIPILIDRGAFRGRHDGSCSLRQRLGLNRPVSRYAS